MKAGLENQILLRCPTIYRGRHLGPNQNLMCFGFACGDGWFQIIYDLSAHIEDIAQRLKESGVQEERLPCVSQVKEKFGGLRFYIHNYYDDMAEQIDKAQEVSLKTCDSCGGNGRGRYMGAWFRTICDACAAKQT